MSRTYKYPKEVAEGSVNRDEANSYLERMERQKHRKRKRIQRRKSFIKFVISYRDKLRTKVKE